MANMARNASAPLLLNLDDNTYVIVGLKTPTDDEDDDSDGDGIGSDNFRDMASTNESVLSLSSSSNSEMLLSPFDASPRSRINTMPALVDEIFHRGLLPDRYYSHSQEMLSTEPESSASTTSCVQPRLAKKTRPAPLPPDTSPASSLRHSYAMASLGSSEFSHHRTSTDTESVTSESRFMYHTSTDSDTMLPESARGSNFPGELAGVDNLQQLQDRMVVSPRTAHSRFKVLRDKLGRSPQVGRRKSKKEKEDKLSPRLRKQSRKDEGIIKSPRLRKHASVDSAQVELSDFVFGFGYGYVEANEEFEIKRVPDFDRFLTELLSETDPSHPDFEDLTKASKRVRSMVREREDELYEPDNQSVMDSIQDRFPLDELHLSDCPNDRSNPNNNLDMSYNNNNNNNNGNTGNDLPDDTDKSSSAKNKGVSVRRRSAPSAVIFKSLTGSRSRSSNSLWSNAGMGKKDNDLLHATAFRLVDSDSNRMFLMEGPVQLATGMQIQERYLFLFSDLLLVAKQKSSSSFKLKCRVQLCDMWIASCIDVVSEITRPQERSFVIGWPTTNSVASFPDVDTKQKWLQALSESIVQEKIKDEQKTIPLKVDTKDIESVEKVCQMSINNVTTANDVLVQCLNQLGLSENELADYHLWVLSGKEGSPYPLIGHETPFSIKLSQEREFTRSRSRDDINTMTSGDLDSVDDRRGGNQKCEFYLKQKKSPKKHQLDNSAFQKSVKKSKKSPSLFNQLLRKIRQPQSHVFSHQLSEICDENMEPPESIMKLMILVYRVGPGINGIMRRGNNASLGKDIREKIDSELKYSLEDHQVPTAASVFKEFLRCIPGGLLSHSLRDQWADINMDDPENVKVEKIKGVLKQLPVHNYRLLMYTICLLQHLSKHSEVTNMGPGNLSTCIAPSLCATQGVLQNHGKWPASLSAESLKQVQDSMMELTNVYTPLITFMIIKHREIFGDEILNMFVKFDCIPSPPVSLEEGRQDQENSSVHTNTEDEAEEDMEEDEEEEEEEEEDEEVISFSSQQAQKRYRQNRHHRKLQHQSQRNSNSGTDSDSTHSVLSMPDTGVRRDDSSVDSLVDREYYPTENDSSPKPIKSHLSPSNLSRDSGLTLSDTQLYDEDGDAAMNVGKMYGRTSSHYDDLESSDPLIFTRDGRSNPVPPPRTKSTKSTKKIRINSDGNKLDHYVGLPSQHCPPPFKHSASTPQLDIYTLSRSVRDSTSGGIHPPLGKRISSDSIGEEVEPPAEQCLPDLKRLSQLQDIGTIVKTHSGTHLYLRNEMPSKFNADAAQKRDHHFVRQASATDSTPPVSPQSHLSQSSRDSLHSDSTHSASRDSLFHSAPQTPDSPSDNVPPWVPHSDKAFRPWNDRLGRSLNGDYESRLSKSTSDILQQGNEEEEDDFIPHFEVLSESSPSAMQRQENWSDAHIQKYKPSSPKFYMGKSHEAEEIDSSSHVHFSLMLRQESNIEDEVKTVMASESNRNSASNIQHSNRFHQLLQGSPPPSVLLQNLQQAPARRESTPMRASYDEAIVAQLRRSSADAVGYPPIDPAKSMNSIRPEEYQYQRVVPKPILIPPLYPIDDQPGSGRIKSPKYNIVPNAEVSLKGKAAISEAAKRPDKPPCYQQALQRNFMIKQNVPVDVAMNKPGGQRESCSHARAMYEKSLQLYDEQRKTSPEVRKSSAKSTSSSESKDVHSNFPHAEKSKLSPVISSSVNSKLPFDFSQSDASNDFSASPHSHDDSGAAGFMDLGSISHSLQEDVITQRNSQLCSNPGSISAASSFSIHRTDSKLSDTGSSSGGSSVTLSTLSHHSDSFCHRSDISNVTVSSVTSSDSNSDTSIMSSRRRSGSGYEHNMAYSRHFRPLEPDSVNNSRKFSSEDEDEEMYEEDVYVTLKKDSTRKNPKQIYMESIQLFEQNVDPLQSIPSSTASNVASSLSSSSTSSASSSYSLTPRSSTEISSSAIKDPLQEYPSKPSQTKTIVSSLQIGSLSSSYSQSIGPKHGSANRANTFQSPYQLGSSLPARTKSFHAERSRSDDKELKNEFNDGLPTDHHANFMKARSCFYSPDDDQVASLTHPVNTAAPTTQSPAENTLQINAPLNNPTTNVPSKESHKSNEKSNVSSGESKKELPWSVKDLKMKFDPMRNDPTSNNNISSNNNTSNNSRSGRKISQASIYTETTSTVNPANRPRSPPSYTNPPPFKRSLNNARASTSSTSSGASDSSANKFPSNPRTASHSHRYGPQSNGLDGYASCSSSEESFNSSLDRKAQRTSLQELDALADHTHITYV